MSIKVEKVLERESKEFLSLPWKIYPKKYPAWVPPLRYQVKDLLDERKNPFYRHAQKSSFLARDEAGVVRGRISVFLDQNHNSFHQEKTAFFGFFESENNQTVAENLFRAAETQAKAWGANLLRGPFNLNSNYESGLLVEGFEDPPVMGMTYHPPYYQDLITACGFEKVKDLYAYYLFRHQNPPEKIMKRFKTLKAQEGIVLRSFNSKDFDGEIERAFEVYNDAWEKNWGFIPLSKEEFIYQAKEMKSILDPRFILFAEVKGEVAGFSLALPDINRILAKIPSGRLFPSGIFKFLWYLKGPSHRKTVDRIRILALGVKRKFQAMGLGPLLYSEYYPRGKALGIQSAECSWVLEDNRLMNRALQLMGAQRLKTYRIFEKLIDPI